MKSYCILGWSLILLHVALAAALAPAGWSGTEAALFGALYLMVVWGISGLYVADILHMGIAHRALAFPDRFVKATTYLNALVGIYVDPRGWVNRHRHHHAFADREGDPSKHAEDGFWKTLYLCLAPYPCKADLAGDVIFESRTLRVACHPCFAMLSQAASFGLVWIAVQDPWFALALWIGVRLVALWVNMIQNFWSHDRRFGSRRYHEDRDNGMNITEWLPVTATFSACLQNNHHHHPQFARMSHDDAQYDFGLLSLRWLKACGLVRARASGAEVPPGVPLPNAGF